MEALVTKLYSEVSNGALEILGETKNYEVNVPTHSTSTWVGSISGTFEQGKTYVFYVEDAVTKALLTTDFNFYQGDSIASQDWIGKFSLGVYEFEFTAEVNLSRVSISTFTGAGTYKFFVYEKG